MNDEMEVTFMPLEETDTTADVVLNSDSVPKVVIKKSKRYIYVIAIIASLAVGTALVFKFGGK